MSPEQEKSIQLRVGLFTLVGLVIIAGMVTYFGRLGEGVKSFYPITVHYPNAAGLLKGADVLMAGAKIGKVSEGPRILPGSRGVSVELKIEKGIEIPSGSVFTIGSSGLLGDRFVDIAMNSESAPPIPPGSQVDGNREMGLGDLAIEGAQLIAEARQAIGQVNTILGRVNNDLLSDETVADIGKSVENLRATSDVLSKTAGSLDSTLRETSETIAGVAKKVDGVVDKADSVIGQAKQTMTAASDAAKEVSGAAADARRLLQDARTGKGVIPMLLSDKQFAAQIRSLVENLRRHGILFYRDRPAPAPQEDRSR